MLTTDDHLKKFGLLASSTPFLTGRPVTLFHNDNIYSEGAVGIALAGSANPVSLYLDFGDVQTLSPVFTLTKLVSMIVFITIPNKCARSTEGNLVLSLDNQNPTRLLLDAIQAAGLGNRELVKDDDFFLGVLRDNGQVR
jgi:small ligand-binding sensory domain FIST